MRRRGVTLIELMVSIGIFAVVAAAMLTMLFGATELFRRGEAARQAGDEATMVLASLREDLARLVPVRMRQGSPAPEWGWLRSEIASTAGDCDLWLTTVNPELAQVSATGTATASNAVTATRILVRWYVARPDPADPSQNELHRATYPWAPGTPPAHGGAPSSDSVITRGCLHFGVWFEMPELHRPVVGSAGAVDIRWEGTPTQIGQPPQPGSASLAQGAYDSSQPPDAMWGGGFDYWPMADAARISLVLTGGGRYATRGTLARDISDSDTQMRIAGIKALPTVAGSLLRIGDEWIRYDDFRGGVVTLSAASDRGALRSAKNAHGARSIVLAGQVFSLVVELPR